MLKAALERHLRDTNPLADQPTVRICRFALLELGDMLAFGAQSITALVDFPCRERLADAHKAVLAFERVLEIDPEQADALADLAALYTDAGDGERLIAVDEKLLALTKDPEEHRRLMFDMAGAAEKMLKEPRRAFEWYHRAYHEVLNPV